jgi:hypothetical protein
VRPDGAERKKSLSRTQGSNETERLSFFLSARAEDARDLGRSRGLDMERLSSVFFRVRASPGSSGGGVDFATIAPIVITCRARESKAVASAMRLIKEGNSVI